MEAKPAPSTKPLRSNAVIISKKLAVLIAPAKIAILRGNWSATVNRAISAMGKSTGGRPVTSMTTADAAIATASVCRGYRRRVRSKTIATASEIHSVVSIELLSTNGRPKKPAMAKTISVASISQSGIAHGNSRTPSGCGCAFIRPTVVPPS